MTLKLRDYTRLLRGAQCSHRILKSGREAEERIREVNVRRAWSTGFEDGGRESRAKRLLEAGKSKVIYSPLESSEEMQF